MLGVAILKGENVASEYNLSVTFLKDGVALTTERVMNAWGKADIDNALAEMGVHIVEFMEDYREEDGVHKRVVRLEGCVVTD